MSNIETLVSRVRSLVGTVPVYTQPPNQTPKTGAYILLTRSDGETLFADNSPYRFSQIYDLIIVSQQPNDELVELVAKSLQGAAYDRFWFEEYNYHDSFRVYLTS